MYLPYIPTTQEVPALCLRRGTVLPFGLRLSPRTFVKCTMAVLAPLQRKGLRLSTHIYDWLLHGDSPLQVTQHTELVLSHLRALGFTVNLDKSILVPTQRIDFIGVSLDSLSMTARLSQDRLASFQSLLSEFQLGRTVVYRTCMRLVGTMASALPLVPLGRFHYRPFCSGCSPSGFLPREVGPTYTSRLPAWRLWPRGGTGAFSPRESPQGWWCTGRC